MIYVDRNKVNAPKVLTEPNVRKLYNEAKHFFGIPERKRRQEHFHFNTIYFHSSVRDALKILFSNKCAYCESKLDASYQADIDHFRPKAGAVGSNGEYWPDHYWWLAYTWSNLYLACRSCNNFKGSKFPTDGKPAPLEASLAELQSEKRLLIDPCADDPLKHLVFDASGIVNAKTEHGLATIAVLVLNRPDLVLQRDSETLYLIKFIHSIRPRIKRIFAQYKINKGQSDLLSGLRDMVAHASIGEPPQSVSAMRSILERQLSADSPFLGMKCQILNDWLSEAKGSPSTVRADSKLVTPRIETIEVHNFKAISHIELDFSSGPSEGAPWLMLLGENATGKSSILQAVALTLIGGRTRNGLAIDASRVVRFGAEHGYVKVKLSNRVKPVTLNFNAKSRLFTGNAIEIGVPVLGYGTTRLLPNKGHRAPSESTGERLCSLFDPFSPLMDARRWLGRQNRKAFDYIARAVIDVLPHDLGLGRAIRLIPAKDQTEGFRVIFVW